MLEHITLTITDEHGVKQFHLHKFFKKFILYILLFIILIGATGIGIILYLQYTYEQAKPLIEKSRHIVKDYERAKGELEEKQVELEKLSTSLATIEKLIGLTPEDQESLEERSVSVQVNSEHMATLFQFVPSGAPVKSGIISSKYGVRKHPTLKRAMFHRGLDFVATIGTPVYATADGIAAFCGFDRGGFGKLVILQHNYGFTTHFAHLNQILIKSGRFVKKGELIGYSGNTGQSSGPHLHYEIRFVERFLNPESFVKWDVTNFNKIFNKERSIPWQSLLAATAHIKVPNPTQAPQSSQRVRNLGAKLL